MTRLFRVYDPVQVLILIGVALFLKLQFILFGEISPFDINRLQLGQMLAGEDGLYRDVVTNIGPIPAWTYQFLGLLFGPSYLSHILFSTLLVVFQAFLFNRAMYINKSMPKLSNIPALLYVSFGVFCYEMIGLSPVLIALCFIIPAFDLLLRDENRGDKNVFWIGFFLGCASFCLIELSVFLPLFAISLLIYQSYSLRQYLMLLVGFLMVFAIMAVVYFVSDGLKTGIEIYVFSIFQSIPEGSLSVGNVISIVLIPIAILGLAVSNTYKNRYNSNRQTGQQTIFLFFGLASLALLFLHPFQLTDFLILLIIPLSFFGSQFIINMNSYTKSEGVYWIVVVLFLANTYFIYFPFANFSLWWNQSEHYSVNVPTTIRYENKKIAVFTSYPALYKNNIGENPYLNWDISVDRYLKNLDSPESVLNAYKRLDGDHPEVIIADKGVMQYLSKFLPQFTSQFNLSKSVKLLPDLKELEVYELKGDPKAIISEEDVVRKS